MTVGKTVGPVEGRRSARLREARPMGPAPRAKAKRATKPMSPPVRVPHVGEPEALRQRIEKASLATGRPGVLVHIGLNKTGSSTIQAWLVSNRAALAEAGVAYDPLRPKDGPGLAMLHGYYAAALADTGVVRRDRKLRRAGGMETREELPGQIEDFTRRAEAAIAAAPQSLHVISSELIAARVESESRIRAFDQWLRQRFGRVEYVVYLRDQVDWVPSAYAEAVTQGSGRSLDHFVDEWGLNDYYALLTRWAKAVSPGRINVRLLEPGRLRDGDLVADFAALVGADPDLTVKPGRTNEALPALRLRGLRVTNQAGRFLMRFGLPDLRPSLGRLTGPLDRGPKLKLPDDVARRVAEMNAPGNEALRAWLYPDSPTLFPRSARLLAGPERS